LDRAQTLCKICFKGTNLDIDTANAALVASVETMPDNKTLVLGIGNTLLSDEGAGIHALAYLNEHYPAPDGVEYVDGGTLSFVLAGAIENADNLIVLDATQLNAPPGTVCHFVDAEMDSFLGNARRSVHEVGLVDLMDMVRLTERLPQRRALIGIQPQTLDWGERPSEPVSGAIPRAAELVQTLLARWH
jgi:hydrogenase maturation protease